MKWIEVRPPGLRRALVAWFDLDDAGGEFEKILSPEETSRAARYARERDARRFAAGRASVRRALGGLLGIAPRDVVLACGPHGRPQLRGGAGAAFSFSHAGAAAVLAVVEKGSVGVDVEAGDSAPDPEDLAPLVLSQPELEELLSLPASERPADFLRRFTAREAVLKAAGTGFCCDPRSIALAPEGSALAASGDPRVDGLVAWPLDAAAGFVAALATDRDAG